MPIEFQCPQCGKRLRISDANAGKRGTCNACGQMISVPPTVPSAQQSHAQPKLRPEHLTEPPPIPRGDPGAKWAALSITQKRSAIGAGVALVLIILCSGLASIGNRQETNSTTAASTERSVSAIPTQDTSYTRAGAIEDVSYGAVKRVTARIHVPLGRTREELTATLERAAQDIAQETRANAVTVFAYRPQDEPTGQYSAGTAVHAPNGTWEDADSSAPMRTEVVLSDLYFAPPSAGVASGDSVLLRSDDGGEVLVSATYSSWMDDDIIARIPSGTEAKVVERRSEPIANQEFIRYRVRVNIDGAETVGWVHSGDVGRN